MAHKVRETKTTTVHPLTDHPDYVSAIGMVSLETIALEVSLATLFARMIGVPPRIGHAIYLTPKAEQTRLDMLRHTTQSRLAVSERKKNTRLGQQQSRYRRKIMKIVASAQDTMNRRHRVIHDEWNYSDKEQAVTRKRIDGNPGRARIKVDLNEVLQLIEDIRKTIDAAQSLSEVFRERPPFMANLSISAIIPGSAA